MADFNHTSILNLIQKHAKYFEALLQLRNPDGKPALKNAHHVTACLNKSLQGKVTNHDEMMKVKRLLDSKAF